MRLTIAERRAAEEAERRKAERGGKDKPAEPGKSEPGKEDSMAGSGRDAEKEGN